MVEEEEVVQALVVLALEKALVPEVVLQDRHMTVEALLPIIQLAP